MNTTEIAARHGYEPYSSPSELIARANQLVREAEKRCRERCLGSTRMTEQMLRHRFGQLAADGGAVPMGYGYTAYATYERVSWVWVMGTLYAHCTACRDTTNHVPNGRFSRSSVNFEACPEWARSMVHAELADADGVVRTDSPALYAGLLGVSISRSRVIHYLRRLRGAQRREPKPPHNDAARIEFLAPVDVRRDDRGRPHCADGPAIIWPDAEPEHYWHGVPVDHELLTCRITRRKLEQTSNVEHRRVLLERYIAEGGQLSRLIKPVHRDRFGVLYRVGRFTSDPLAVLVTDPSTGRQYLLTVPPSCRTAHEAVAWTYDKTPATYNPVIRR